MGSSIKGSRAAGTRLDFVFKPPCTTVARRLDCSGADPVLVRFSSTLKYNEARLLQLCEYLSSTFVFEFMFCMCRFRLQLPLPVIVSVILAGNAVLEFKLILQEVYLISVASRAYQEPANDNSYNGYMLVSIELTLLWYG